MLLLAALVFAVLFAAAGLEYRRQQQAKYMPLTDALAAFNASAVEDSVGRLEPPLTEAEVLAAIRRQLPTLMSSPDREAHPIYLRIAETKMVPRTASFRLMSSYTKGEVTTAVWWVNLNVVTDEDADWVMACGSGRTMPPR